MRGKTYSNASVAIRMKNASNKVLHFCLARYIFLETEFENKPLYCRYLATFPKPYPDSLGRTPEYNNIPLTSFFTRSRKIRFQTYLMFRMQQYETR